MSDLLCWIAEDGGDAAGVAIGVDEGGSLNAILALPFDGEAGIGQHTNQYRDWVEAYARNHQIPTERAEKGTRKEDYALPALRRMENQNAYGVYFIFKSLEQGRTFRISVPKFPTKDPSHRILAHQRSRFTHYYFYSRDAVLGPIIVGVASFFPFHATYWLNGHSLIEQELKRKQIGFRKTDNAFLAVDNVAELQAAADRLSAESSASNSITGRSCGAEVLQKGT